MLYFKEKLKELINDRQFKKICKSLNRLKLSHDMEIFMNMWIIRMQVERIPKLENEMVIGHIFSQKALDMATDDEMRKELSPEPFFLCKNIFVPRGRGKSDILLNLTKRRYFAQQKTEFGSLRQRNWFFMVHLHTGGT